MAQHNYRAYFGGDTVELKKYFYVLRPLLAALWIEQGRGIAPMRFQDLVDTLITDPQLHHAIDRLLAHKRAAGEAEHGTPIPLLHAFIDREFARLAHTTPPTATAIQSELLDRFLHDTILTTPPPPAS